MKEKSTTKVVVIDDHKGVDDSFILTVEHYFGKNTEVYVKSVVIDALDEELTYQPAQQVIVMPAVGHRLNEIIAVWDKHYPNNTTRFLVLGNAKTETGRIEYATDVGSWLRKNKKQKIQ